MNEQKPPGGPVTAPGTDRAGTPDSRSTPGTAPGQAAYEAVPEVYRRWLRIDQSKNWDGPSESLIRELWSEKSAEQRAFWRSLDAAQAPSESAVQAAFDAFWGSPALGREPSAPLGKEAPGIQAAWRAAVTAAIAAAAPAPAAEGGVILDRLSAAVANHEAPLDRQWYVDEHVIDCDAAEFWTVLAAALPQTAPGLAAAMAQLADAKDDFLFERKQVVALRQVLTEIFTCLAAGDPALLDDDQVSEWSERSGVDLP